jgi:hypothetical protein
MTEGQVVLGDGESDRHHATEDPAEGTSGGAQSVTAPIPSAKTARASVSTQGQTAPGDADSILTVSPSSSARRSTPSGCRRALRAGPSRR